jgi:hypothetical protein
MWISRSCRGRATPVSRNGLRRALGKLGDQVSQSLLDAGFQFDPKDIACKHSQNENRYTVWQIPYGNADGAGQGLRPTIQIELTMRHSACRQWGHDKSSA